MRKVFIYIIFILIHNTWNTRIGQTSTQIFQSSVVVILIIILLEIGIFTNNYYKDKNNENKR